MTEYDDLLQIRFSCAGDEEAPGYVACGTGTLNEIVQCIHDKRLVIGLDQATHKTGCCIMDFDSRKPLVVLDLINLGFPSKVLYFQSIYDFFRSHIEDETIVLFVYEIPIEHSKDLRARQALEAMRLFIRDFQVRMPSLSKANMIEINVNTWRSHFLADGRYQGQRKKRELVKQAAREEASRRCPDFAQYFGMTDEPPDSCDAVGIAFGALDEIYSKTNPTMRRPNRTMPITRAKVNYKVLPLTVDELEQLLNTDFHVYFPKHCEFLEFNDTMTVEENCKRFSCNCGNLGVMPITSPKVCQELKWETGKELAEDQMYFAFCWRG